jgi:hypothetical protein
MLSLSSLYFACTILLNVLLLMKLSHSSPTFNILQLVVCLHFLVFLLHWSCSGLLWLVMVLVLSV